MPRMARQKSITKVYHIILRGNAKQDIFFDRQDYRKFLKEIYKTKEKYGYELYAYCLMTNHVHLVIYDKSSKLSKVIQSITISYSSYFNTKYERVGHLFQNRFLSKNIETGEYLKNVCRYIHQNPVKSEIAKVERYEWSSYSEYLNKEKIINKKQLLQLFDTNEEDAIKNFIAFHKDNLQKDKLEDFIEYEITPKLNDEQATRYIIQILKLKNINELKDFSVEKRKNYLQKLKGISGISVLQMARITGFNRKMIDAIINSERRRTKKEMCP